MKSLTLKPAVCLPLLGILLGGNALAGPIGLYDFAVYGGGGITTGTSAAETFVGSDATINGNIGSNQDVELAHDAHVNGGVYAGGALTVGSDATIGSAGQAVTIISNLKSEINGQLYGQFHSGSGIAGAGAGVDSVLLKSNAAVHGDLFTKRDLHFNQNSGIAITSPPGTGHATVGGAVVNLGTNTISGGATTSSTAGLQSWAGLSMPAATVFASGGAAQTCTGGGCAALTIAPGSYGALTVGANKTITLSSGNYYFDSITFTNSDITLQYDLSSGGPLNIYVTGNAQFGSNQVVKVKGAGDLGFTDISAYANKSIASNVYLETKGLFSMNTDNEWVGTVYSSVLDVGADEVMIGTDNKVWGALYAYDSVRIGGNSVINYVGSYLNAQTLSVSALVPEPGIIGLFGIGLLGLLVGRKNVA